MTLLARKLSSHEQTLAVELITRVHDAVDSVLKQVAEDEPPVTGATLELLILQALMSHVGAHTAILLQMDLQVEAADYVAAAQMVTALKVAVETHACGRPGCDYTPRLLVQEKRYTRRALKLARQLHGVKVPIIP